MNLYFKIFFLIILSSSLSGQTYTINQGGTISTCSGTFYDAGGTGNYGNNQDYTITFCPSTPGQVICVTFTSLDTENYSSNYDRLFVYDGNSTAATQIGSYAGTTSPGVINVTGSNATGCLTFRFRSDGGVVGAGWVATISCVAPPPPIVNMTNGTYTVCSATFYDAGGSGSNYLNNDSKTVVFCPSTPGQCIRTAFSSFDLEDNFDYLSVYNGNSTSAPMILGSSYTSASPGNITATTTNATGCLTFKFYSDGATTASGWAATIACTTCASPPANGVQQDCNGAATICSNQNVNGTSLGSGSYNDLNLGLGNLGCLNDYAATPNGSAEHQSNWYFFSPSASGTIGMTIAPASSATDYDWAIFGPYTSVPCPPTGAPLRCSAATAANSTGGNTGLGNGAADTDEGSNGNGWVSAINVIAGQKYILFLDNWNATSAPFTLSWQLSNGAALGCTLLPMELISFKGANMNDHNLIEWITNSEKDNDHFTIERSDDALYWKEIAIVKGAGNSSQNKYYGYKDHTFSGNTINYYRLKQTDFTGHYKYSEHIVTIETPNVPETYIGTIHPNPTTANINFDCISAKNGKIEIQIMDYTGKVFVTENMDILAGKNDIAINLSDFKNGIYFLKITGNLLEKAIFQKIIKQ
ncbi:MAG: CUB domain-containing protein [Bacteroidota bacterium]